MRLILKNNLRHLEINTDTHHMQLLQVLNYDTSRNIYSLLVFYILSERDQFCLKFLTAQRILEINYEIVNYIIWDKSMSTNMFISLEDGEFKSIADVYVQTLHTKYLVCQHLPLPKTDSDQKALFLPMNFNRMQLH